MGADAGLSEVGRLLTPKDGDRGGGLQSAEAIESFGEAPGNNCMERRTRPSVDGLYWRGQEAGFCTDIGKNLS